MSQNKAIVNKYFFSQMLPESLYDIWLFFWTAHVPLTPVGIPS